MFFHLLIAGGSPSFYVMYKFYTFPDHDTPIVAHSPSPVFDDQQLYPLSMDQRLDDYLKTEVCAKLKCISAPSHCNYLLSWSAHVHVATCSVTSCGVSEYS